MPFLFVIFQICSFIVEQVNFVSWKKTITKGLNPFAEGIVGGLIGGETMAVVSAIDAKGRTRQEKIEVDEAVEIQYHPKGDLRTVKRLVFSCLSRGSAERWTKTLCRCAHLPEPRYIEPEKKGPTYL